MADVTLTVDTVEAIDLLAVLSGEAHERAKLWRQLEERRAGIGLCEQAMFAYQRIERVITRLEEQTYPERSAA